MGSVPSQGTWEGQPINVSLSHRCFSPFPSPFLLLSLKINKVFKKQLLNKDLLVFEIVGCRISAKVFDNMQEKFTQSHWGVGGGAVAKSSLRKGKNQAPLGMTRVLFPSCITLLETWILVSVAWSHVPAIGFSGRSRCGAQGAGPATGPQGMEERELSKGKAGCHYPKKQGGSRRKPKPQLSSLSQWRKKKGGWSFLKYYLCLYWSPFQEFKCFGPQRALPKTLAHPRSKKSKKLAIIVNCRFPQPHEANLQLFVLLV